MSARIQLVAKAKHPKDRAAGWHRWRLNLKACPKCDVEGAICTVHGTEADARRFAESPETLCDTCDQ